MSNQIHYFLRINLLKDTSKNQKLIDIMTQNEKIVKKK